LRAPGVYSGSKGIGFRAPHPLCFCAEMGNVDESVGMVIS
jgi:hypothetical protein